MGPAVLGVLSPSLLLLLLLLPTHCTGGLHDNKVFAISLQNANRQLAEPLDAECVVSEHEMVTAGVTYTCKVLCEETYEASEAEHMATQVTSKASTMGGRTYVMVIENDLTHAVAAFWRGYDKREASYGVVAAGAIRVLESFPGHAWVFRKVVSGRRCGAAVAVFDGTGVQTSPHHINLSQFRRKQSPIRCDEKQL